MHEKIHDLTLLISEPKQPSVEIDVYLKPLVDNLKILWNEDIKVYDVYKEEQFIMKGVLLWTIIDFLTYNNLSQYMNKKCV